MNLTMTGLVTESHFKIQPETAGAAALWRNITRGRVEFPTADGAISQYLTPVSDVTYTFENFPAVELNSAPILTAVGLPAAFEGLYLLHLRVAAYRPDLPSSGTVAATLTDLFGAGAHDCGILNIGDELIRTKKMGFPLIATSALALVVNDPVNLAIEIMLIGTETTGGIYT